jgi:hypothetical protein
MNEHDCPKKSRSLSDDVARRLLARASEIDSDHSAELTLADLRQASLEAGIAPIAFEQALIELQESHSVSDSHSGSTTSTTARWLPAALLNSSKTVGLVLATMFVLMLLVDLF